jgi:Ca2+-transporting ATPase
LERAAALPYEAMAILAIVLLNALMGYVQQTRAEQAVMALRRMSAASASVVRDGRRQSIAATGLVPSDVMLIEEGDTISADARVTESTMLQMAEAPLTGESLPVPKSTVAIVEEAGLGDRPAAKSSGQGETAAVLGRTL